MAKTKPIGVRFDEDLLNKLKEANIIDSPQKALNLYEKSYVELTELKIEENNKPENKAKIEAERNVTINSIKKEFKQPLLPSKCTDKPIQIKGEDNWDYKIRVAEWKEKQNK